ncbi:MAG: glucose-6-phosphate isomerase [Anaeroplasmataceae bacterium]
MKVNFKYTEEFYNKEMYDKAYAKALEANNTLRSMKGEGNDYLGWLKLPLNPLNEELKRIIEASNRIKETSKALLVIGIGGSYLGAKSAIEMLSSYFSRDIDIIFVGNNMSSSYIYEVYNKIKDIDFSINIISKSGSTTETSIATRIFLDLLVKKYGDKAYDRVYATTDLNKGILNNICNIKKIPMFSIPDNVGGRYSVLTAVGLLPIAVAGFDIYKILDGAKKACLDMENINNDAIKYAALRYLFYSNGYDIEIMSSFEPKMKYFIEWYKQLFAESEGKDHKGLFPTGANFSTDLHSIGQMIQDGKRNIIETMISIKKPMYDINVCSMDQDLDKLDFILGESVNDINNKALKATALAHKDGGVPVIIMELDTLDEFNYGYLVYFFMYACGVSAYTLDINPFNQPGVESYKRNMFALIGKPGYEDIKEELLKSLGE